MTALTVRVDAGQAINFFAEARRQLPFATSVAVNLTAKDVQEAVRAGLRARFIIRRDWVVQGITIPKVSDKGEPAPTAVVAVDASRGFLDKFEAGGQKIALNPARPIAIPSLAIRPARTDLPPRSLYPSALGLVPVHGVTGIRPARQHITARGVVQFKGKRRTFVLNETMYGVQVPGVFQRFGPGKHDFRLLWAYKQRIPIPALLQFQDTALKTITARWATNFSNALERALATAR